MEKRISHTALMPRAAHKVASVSSRIQSALLRAAIVILFVLPFSGLRTASAASNCASSAPGSAAYTVTVCLTSPATGSTLNGDTSVTATVSVSGGTSPGIQRMVFYIDGTYLLTDYQKTFTFTLPSARWVDGNHTLSVEALMRDNFTSQQASAPVIFANGVTSPPVNTNQFQPTSGRAPVNGAPFIVAAAGDGASGDAFAGKVSALISSLNPNLFLYLGDVYEKGSATEFYNWYGTASTYFGQLRSITDPTIGNHEYQNRVAPGYFDYWDNIPNYYSYDAGGWHFISLNSNSTNIGVGVGSAQYKWLQQDLAALPADQCTIVYYHHPLFNIGPEGPSRAMSPIWSLLAQYGVDVVLNGHDHNYQRWSPLDGNGQPASGGITEFVAGAGGHSMQTILNIDSRVAYSNSLAPTAFGVLLLQLNQRGANFSYVNTSQSILDSGVIPCVPAATDSQTPTTPGGFFGNVPVSTRVDLTWTASSDDVGVAGYSIYRNGAAIATVPAVQLAYSDTTVAASTTYSYSVDAFDLAGNHSALTTAISLTTDYDLTIISAHGTVSANKPAPYHYNELLQLTDLPDPGWTFSNWTGDVTGTSNPISITMNGGKSVTANYTQNEYSLTVTSAHGTVNADIPGPYHYGDVVKLTAIPAAGWGLANWTGDVTSSSNPVSVTIHGDTSVTANYSQDIYSLAVSSAHGTVSADAPGPYHYGDVVHLTAAPDAGWGFTSWTGDLVDTANPLSVIMDSSKVITANYDALIYTISGSVGVGGAVVTYSGGSTNADGNGNYSFGVLYGWSGTVTPSAAGYVFSPAGLTYADVTTDVSDQSYTAFPLASVSFQSLGTQDGWVLETAETTNMGGLLDAGTNVLKLGDDAARRQYRSVLSFKTAGLPDNAAITGATLTVTKKSIIGGGDPFNILNGLMIDARKGFFGAQRALESGDFQAAGGKITVGPFKPVPSGAVYSIDLPGAALPYINTLGTDAGLTQLRLRFKLDDNNDAIANFINFFSGNYGTISSRPTLTITYYIP